MERFVTLFFLSTVVMHTTSATEAISQGKPELLGVPSPQASFRHKLLGHLLKLESQGRDRPDLMSILHSRYFSPPTKDIVDGLDDRVGYGISRKRSGGSREKKEQELAYLLQNLIFELDSEEAKNLSAVRRLKSVSGESSGEMTFDNSADAGSKRKYGNIFRGPLEASVRTPPRPRRQRKFRIDPVMFWMGIGK